MNTGTQVVDWLYREQLKVDAEWSVRTPSGFTWWADKNAQTIEVAGSEQDEPGNTAYLIAVRTEFLRNFRATPETLEAMNAFMMSIASMAGPVYDAASSTVSLCSLIRVHDGIRAWISPLISMAAILQIHEARVMGATAAELFDAKPAESQHPESGVRSEPDELASVVETLVAPFGKERCRWKAPEFRRAAKECSQRPRSLNATNDGASLTLQFPYGKDSSLCEFRSDQDHPRYGSGLLLLQSFRVGELNRAQGAKLALDLNAAELADNPAGYGFGSYCYRDTKVHFTSFLPNVAYRDGILANLSLSCAARAHYIAERFFGTPSQSSLEVQPRPQSAIARLIRSLRH